MCFSAVWLGPRNGDFVAKTSEKLSGDGTDGERIENKA
jgi:hypothetical protein